MHQIECKGCEQPFTPKRKDQYCCSVSCRNKNGYKMYLAKRKAAGRARQITMYGISLVGWLALFSHQGERCAICGTSEPGESQSWHTDHDHSTGKIRGILCRQCNLGLGHFKDSRLTVEAASHYLAASAN